MFLGLGVVFFGSVLTALVTMKDEFYRRPFPFLAHLVSCRRPCRGDLDAKTICDNGSTAQIHDGTEVVSTPGHNDVGDVGNPHFVHYMLFKLPIQDVFISMPPCL